MKNSRSKYDRGRISHIEYHPISGTRATCFEWVQLNPLRFIVANLICLNIKCNVFAFFSWFLCYNFLLNFWEGILSQSYGGWWIKRMYDWWHTLTRTNSKFKVSEFSDYVIEFNFDIVALPQHTVVAC